MDVRLGRLRTLLPGVLLLPEVEDVTTHGQQLQKSGSARLLFWSITSQLQPTFSCKKPGICYRCLWIAPHSILCSKHAALLVVLARLLPADFFLC
jgi:hypothetical protein